MGLRSRAIKNGWPVVAGARLKYPNQPPPGGPVPTGKPVITGALTPGSTITISTGPWTNNPDYFEYQVKRNGTAVGVRSTANTFDIPAGYADMDALVATVYASNDGGVSFNFSNSDPVYVIGTKNLSGLSSTTSLASGVLTNTVPGGGNVNLAGASATTTSASGVLTNASPGAVNLVGSSATSTAAAGALTNTPPAAGGISFVGQSATANSNTTSMPAHQVGDLIVVFAYNSASATAITAPTDAGTYTNINNGFGNTNAHFCAYKIATSNAEQVGAWANANTVAVHVYRGVDQTTPIGGQAQMTNVADVTYPAITMQKTDGTSWVGAFAGIRNAGTAVETPPTGMVNRSDAVFAANNEVAGHDTNGGVSSWASTSVSAATGFRYRTSVFEIRKAA